MTPNESSGPGVLSYIRAHRKALLAALGALLILFLPDEDAVKEIVAIVDAILVLAVPNDEYEKARIYGR